MVRKIISILLSTALFTLLVNSCEVGLGSSVDTERPKISITYPPANAIIRDSFTFAGICSDDKGVKSVKLTIHDSEGKELSSEIYKAPAVTVNSDKTTWQVQINEPVDEVFPLKDGSYTLKVKAVDESGRESDFLPRSFQIDNTAPVFVISSPGTTDVQTAAKYGSTFKVTGSIAEEHSVSFMELTVYDKDGRPVGENPWLENDINTSGGTSVIFANYSTNAESADKKLYDRYLEAYGNSKGTIAYSASIVLGDNAGLWKTPVYTDDSGLCVSDDANETHHGNYTNKIWLNDDVYAQLLSTKDSSQKLQISDLMKVLNGSLENETAKSLLAQTQTDTNENHLQFTLNKDANPKYQLLGMIHDATTDAGEVKVQASKGGSITFKAEPGLNGTNIEPKTFQIYMFGPYKEIGSTGTAPEFTSQVLNSVYNEEFENYIENNPGIATLLYDGTNGVPSRYADPSNPTDKEKETYGPYSGTSSEGFTVSLTLPSDLISNHIYVIAAKGVDQDDVALVEEDGQYFGFRCAISGSAPITSIKSPIDSDITNDNAVLTVKGESLDPDDGVTPIKSVEVLINVYDSLKANTLVGKISGFAECDEGYAFEEGASVSWTFVPALSNVSELQSGYTKNDVINPSNGNIFKYSVKATAQAINGLTGQDQVTVQIDKKLPDVKITSVTNLLDYSGHPEGKSVNGKIEISGTINDSNLDTSDGKIKLYLVQGESVKKTIDLTNQTYFTIEVDTTEKAAGTENPVFEDSKEIQFQLEAFDKAGNRGLTNYKETSNTTVYIEQASDKPVIELSNADKTLTDIANIKTGTNLFNTSDNSDLNGIVKDDDGVASWKAECAKLESSGTYSAYAIYKEGSLNENPTTSSVTIPFTNFEEGVYKIRLTVVDKNGCESIPCEFVVAIDNFAPLISILTQEGYKAAGQDFTVSGNVSDSSGIKSLTRDGETVTFGENGSFTDTVRAGTNGKTLTYTVTDNYGRTSVKEFAYLVDTGKPFISVTNPNGEAAVIAVATADGSYTFRGTTEDARYVRISDREPVSVASVPLDIQDKLAAGEADETYELIDSSSIDVIEYSTDGWTTVKSVSPTGTSWQASVTFEKGAAKKGENCKILFRAKDVAGNLSEVIPVSYICDADVPEIKNISLKYVTGGSDVNLSNNVYYAKAKYKILAEISDLNLKSVVLDGTSVAVTVTGEGESAKSTIEAVVTEPAEGSVNHVLKATDVAGQEVVKNISLVYDKTAPLPNLTVQTLYKNSAGTSEDNANGVLTAKWSVTDSNLLSTTIKICADNGGVPGTVLFSETKTGVYASNYKRPAIVSNLPSNNAYYWIVVVSKDLAGNESIPVTETSQIRFRRDDTTDIPMLSFSGDFDADALASNCEGNNAKNLFGLGSDELIITVEDDDGISKIQYKYDSDSWINVDLNGTTPKTKRVTIPMNEKGSGVHKLSVLVEDVLYSDTSTDGTIFSESPMETGKIYSSRYEKTFNYSYDNDTPNIKVTKIGPNNYYKGMFSSKDSVFTIDASDLSGSITVTGPAGTTISPTETAGIYTCTITNGTTDDEISKTFTVTDMFGRKNSDTVYYKVDETAPDFDLTNNPLLIRAGSKSFNETQSRNGWFNSASVKISGKIIEANKDVMKIFLNGSTTGTEFTESESWAVTTDFDEGVNTFAITAYDLAGNQSTIADKIVNIDTTLPVVNRAAFKLDGNPASEDPEALSFAKNGTVVTIEIEAEDPRPTGNTTCQVSGIHKILIGTTDGFRESSAIASCTREATLVTEKNYYSSTFSQTITIPTADLKSGDYYARVIDGAGNAIASDIKLATITVDVTPPVFSYSEVGLTKASAVNKVAKISGKITSEANPSSNSGHLKLYYWNGSAMVDATQLSGYTANTELSANDWSIELDTSKILPSATGADSDVIYYQVVIEDMAGNKAAVATTTGDAKVRKLYVNQNLDRPVISFNEIDKQNGYIRTSAVQVSGLISDDDGIQVTGENKCEFKVSPQPLTIGAWRSLDCSATVKFESSGLFFYTPEDSSDGEHDLYFYFKDTNGGEFWTGCTTGTPAVSYKLGMPYIIYKDTEAKVDNSSVIVYKSDKTLPSINFVILGTGKTAAEAYEDAARQYAEMTYDSADTTHTGKNAKNLNDMPNSVLVGGTEKAYVVFALHAWDSSEIDITENAPEISNPRYGKTGEAANLEFTTQTKSYKTYAGEEDTEGTTHPVTALYTSAISVADLSTTSAVTQSLTIKVFDKSGMDREAYRTLVITRVGPVVNIVTPEPALSGAAYSNNNVSAGVSVNFQGSTAASGSGRVEKILYKVVDNSTYAYFGTTGDSDTGLKLIDKTTTAQDKTKAPTEARRIEYMKSLIGSGEGKLNETTCKNSLSSASNWMFKMDGESNPMLPNASDETAFASYTKLIHTVEGIYELPIWFYSVDSLGNESCYEFVLKRYNPYGDRPTTKILYPELAKDESGNTLSYATLSGTIRVNGSATDNVSVSAVYVQVDANNDGKYDGADIQILKDYYTIYSVKNNTYGIDNTLDELKKDADPAFWGIKATDTQAWFITLNSEKELNNSYTIIKKANFDDADYYNVKIRAAAVDGGNLLGNWSEEVVIRINPNAPTIGTNIKPYVHVASDSTTRNQVNDMWLKGDGSLVVSVQHSETINEITYVIAASQANLGSSSEIKVVNNGSVVGSECTRVLSTDWSSKTRYDTTGGRAENGYILTIPLGTGTAGSAGSKVVRISAKSSAGISSSEIFTFNYDNKPPVIKDVKSNNTEWAAASIKSLENSDARLTIKNDVQDDNSGFNFAMYYFYRDDRNTEGKNRRIYDPAIKDSTKARIQITGTDNSTNASGIVEKTVDGKKVYGFEKTVSRSDTTTITLSSSSDYVTNGSAVYMNGTWMLLSGSSDNMTYTLSEAVPVSETTAFFPYAKVTDINTGKFGAENPKNWNEASEQIENDDGDGLIEAVSESGTTWTWSSSFHGDYIPDGKITMVIIVFDKSGNVASTTRIGKVQNNTPRIAKLYLGTDISGDGKYSDDEFETYNILGKETVEQSDYDLTTLNYGSTTRKAFTVKDKLAIVPEFTGGNGTGDDMFKMVFKTGDTTEKSSGATRQVTKPASNSNTLGLVLNTKAKFSTTSSTILPKSTLFELTNSQVTGVASPAEANDGSNKKISFTFWDSTDECEQGVDSQSCYVRITDLTVDVTDGVPPKVIIDPFEWKGKGFNQVAKADGSKGYSPNNNLYYTVNNTNFTDSSAFDDSEVNGHIELENDLPAADFKATVAAGKEEYDRDPKVSGKIVIRGTAYDDVRLDSIWVTFDGFTFESYMTDSTDITGTASGAAKQTVTNGKYTYTAANGGDGKTYYLAAKFDGERWSSAGDLISTKHWGFNIINDGVNDSNSFFNQNGHRVDWEFYIDTAYISGVAGLDKNFKLMAVDARGKLASSTADTGKPAVTTAKYSTQTNYGTVNVAGYKMDVVPYVTKVYTTLSKLKNNNWSVYGRTAQGHYILDSAATDTKLYGFNIASSTVTPTVKDSESTANSATVGTYASDSYGSYVPLTNISSLKSGKIVVSVGSVVALNNINNNDASGNALSGAAVLSVNNYKDYAYNRQPNADNNNLLTDDLIFDVWLINSQAAKPISGRIEQPCMKINPIDGQIVFAFANGPLYFSMGGYNSSSYTNSTSYDYWNGSYDFFTSIGLAMDKLGNSYGCAAGGDINSTTADNFLLLSSRWGCSDDERYDGASRFKNTRQRRLEQIGQTNSGVINFNKYRIGSPSMATAVHGTATDLFMVYYDDINNEIRFRAGQIDSTGTATNFGNFTDQYTDTAPQEYSKANCLVLSDSTYQAGEYASVAVASAEGSSVDDKVVVVWYDAENLKLWYTYKTYSTADSLTTNVTKGKAGYSDSGFSRPVAVFGSETNIGEYCKIATDKAGGIHVAAYDSLNGDLIYAYKPSYNTGSFTKYIVDSYGIVGAEITLDVAYDENNQYPVPYIGYYASSCVKPKLAYRKSSTLGAGVDSSESYTGNWEISLVPTSSKVPEDHINVGVTKSNGVITNSTTSSTLSRKESLHNQGGNGKTNSPYNVYSYGYCYANGTKNAIMAYEIKSGSNGTIETAQIR